MQVFYFEEVSNGFAALKGEEAKHCVRVLRKSRGDTISGIDGKGTFFKGPIIDLKKEYVQIRVEEIEKEWGEPNYELCVAMSPLRLEDRFEWFIEKAVEFGASRIIPLVCKHTVKRKVREVRLKKIMISAAKQCMRSRLPVLEDPMEFGEFCAENNEGPVIMGHIEGEKLLSEPGLHKSLVSTRKLTLIVGPEGDFSSKELIIARQKEIPFYHLGHTRFRAETAAIYLMAWAHQQFLTQHDGSK